MDSTFECLLGMNTLIHRDFKDKHIRNIVANVIAKK